jgi:hypothetical protein
MQIALNNATLGGWLLLLPPSHPNIIHGFLPMPLKPNIIRQSEAIHFYNTDMEFKKK